MGSTGSIEVGGDPRTFYSEPGLKAFTEVDEKGEKQYYVEGYISTTEKDLVNDVVTDEALDDMLEQIREHNIKIDKEHEAWNGETDVEKIKAKTIEPRGRIVEADRDEKGLKAKILLNKHRSDFENLWGSIKDGMLDAFSIAFLPEIAKKIERGGELIRKLSKIKLLNVAFTGNPVNPGAKMVDVFTKSLDDIDAENAETLNTGVTQKDIEALRDDISRLEKTVKSTVEGAEPDTTEVTKMPEEKGEPEEGGENPEVKSKDGEGSEFDATEVKSRLDSIEESLSELKSLNDTNEEPEEKSDDDPEEKSGDSDEDPEEKSADQLDDRIESLESELKSLTEKLSEPERKARQTETSENAETKSSGESGPLSYIG